MFYFDNFFIKLGKKVEVLYECTKYLEFAGSEK